MKDDKFKIEEKQLADLLRNEVLNDSQTFSKAVPKSDFSGFEYVSAAKPYISPIMTMNQDEILDYVESHEISELATLTDAELNRISEVLGIDPSILTGKC